MTPYWPEFIALAVIHFLAVVAPGPDFAITVRQSVRYGRQVGVVTALGIGAGISLHVGYTLLGVGALLHAHHGLLMAASLIGAAYLIYLGGVLLRSQPKADAAGAAPVAAGPVDMSFRRAFWMGFLTNATNPKATLFFLAIFTTVVKPSTPLAVQAAYGAWMCGVNAAWFALVALLFAADAVRRRFLRMGHWLERGMGALLLVFALRLLWQTVR
ncbi:MAG: LysE family transporter [Pseudomonadota bacterium]|nr:LysE family transporter [Pseudomonadota bacterium]